MKTTHSEPAHCVIAIAASAGGLNALSVILGALPADFPAAIAIVMHISPDHKSLLAEILTCRTPLEVRQAETGDVLCHSSVFVAVPNHHMFVLSGGIIEISSPTAEKVHFARPSARPLFASVASLYKRNAIAVVLTGGDGDGSIGVSIVNDNGGTVIAQDLATSQDFSMPQTSIETGDVDFILPLEEIAPSSLSDLGARRDLKFSGLRFRAGKLSGHAFFTPGLLRGSSGGRIRLVGACKSLCFCPNSPQLTLYRVAKVIPSL